MESLITEAFKKLFNSSGPCPDWDAKWQQVRSKLRVKVSAIQQAILEAPLTIDELENAL